MNEHRQHESLMTGAEIENLFNDRTVSELEAKHTELLAELEAARAQLKTSEDPDEQEQIKDRMAELREQDRATLEAMRAAQKKFPTIDQLRKSA